MQLRIGAFLVGFLVLLSGGFAATVMGGLIVLGGNLTPRNSEDILVYFLFFGGIIVFFAGLRMMWKSFSFTKKES